MLSLPRPLILSEQDAALNLWQTVFSTPLGFFERYYAADPEYLPGDTFGIWDGDALVSAAHLCRRPVVWGDSTLLCGGIANVATREDYRRQGLSRQILALAITKMEQEGFHFSLLGTGTHGHYAALGWERTRRLQAALVPASHGASEAVSWAKFDQAAPFMETYRRGPRPLQFLRPPAYFERWVGWDWRGRNAWAGLTASGDYLIVAMPEEAGQPLSVLEWRAGDETGENTLLQAAASKALEHRHPSLHLEALPQFLSEEALGALGEVTRHIEDSSMVRNISLAPEEYMRVRGAYETGFAAWWAGDSF